MPGLYLRGAQPVAQQRHQQQQKDPHRHHRHEPLPPTDMDARGAFGERYGQQVRCQGGEKHRAGHAGGRNGGPHQEAAHALHAGVVGVRVVQRRQVTNDRIDGACAARRIGGRKGGQNAIGDHHRVAQGQRALAHGVHQPQRDPPPQPGLFIPQGKHEGTENQPDGSVGEPRDRPGEGLVGGVEAVVGQLLRGEQHPAGKQRYQGDADQPDDRAGQGFQNQADHAA